MAYTTEENANFQPPQPEGTNNISNKLEALLDRVAEALIESPLVNTSTVEKNQKYIINGKLQTGLGAGVLALFQKDIKANEQDLNLTTTLNSGTEQELTISELQNIANQIVTFTTLFVSITEGTDFGVTITISGGGLVGEQDITRFLVLDGDFSNTSQFIPLQKQQSKIDIDKAEEFLDTNIFELLPDGDTRQARITRFFQELGALLPQEIPNFDESPTDGFVDRSPDGRWVGDLEYQQNNSISYAQDNTDGNIDEEDAFIHRLKSTANDLNQTKTIEDIYNTILPYLTDLLEDDVTPQDDRPVYQNQSSGYLKFRNLNQGIIIRNTNNDFIDGLDPNNPTWLTSDYSNLLSLGTEREKINFILQNPGTGFTITMWVRFLDKVSSGTLFNYGNPTRPENPFGFTLETFVINKNDEFSNSQTAEQLVTNNSYLSGDKALFTTTDSERFVRLQVREYYHGGNENYDAGIRDSHVGFEGYRKFSWNPPELNAENPSFDDDRLFGATHIPEDFNEWYFICATYNPIVIEPTDDTTDAENPVSIYSAYQENPDFWMNHINPNINGNDAILPHDYTKFSNYGNKCKVEIISKTDLLRARGFRVE